MANSRELAEQAFSLLQNALRDSEARATELDEQLKRKRAPKNHLEEQLDVLTHRLEAVDAERARWQAQASQLEEVAEAERAKVAQLKKRLEIAESGPEKLTKKEINFWRGKAEDIDTETKDYKTRLASLRREIMERDALIEKLRGGDAGAMPPPAESAGSSAGSSADDLRWQLEQRDERLADLQRQLGELRASQEASNASSGHSLEIQAQIETLRSQVATFDTALSEAQTARASLKADLARAQAQTDQDQRAAREAQAGAERTRATLAEREHRIVELSAEVEHIRAELRQRAEAADTERNELRATLADSQRATERLGADLEQMRRALAEKEHAERGAVASAQAAEAAGAVRDAQLHDQRRQLEQRDRELAELRRELQSKDQSLDEARWQIEQKGQELGARERETADREQALKERDESLAALAMEMEQARAMLEASNRELTSLRDTLLGANRELDILRSHKHSLETEISNAMTRSDATETELARKDDEIRALAEHRAMLERQSEEVAEQMGGLEAELKEEKEHAENLGQLANERREAMTKLQEQAEEAEERYEEAKYRLGKAGHFERIVKRRKGLVIKLLTALRAKAKANTALKAGLDGLRTYKAAAEMNQQKLLQRLDTLKSELQEAEETISGKHGSTHAKEQLATSESKAASLETRLNAQAEVIQTLETELKAARTAQKTGDEKSHEVERLQKELEQKNKLITQLQQDGDEQQRRLAKLRGSESETMRLKAISDKDRSSLDAMEREIAQLREALAKQTSGGPPAGSPSPELEAKLKEREQSVTRLMGTIKEHEATIKKLTDSSESWKRKYQFLSSDSPDAYKTAAEK